MDFFIIFCFFLLSILFVFGGLFVSRLLAVHHPGKIKNSTYECGEETVGSSKLQFNVGYYLFALLFLIFDVEVAFLYPWAVVLREVGFVGLVEVGVFSAILIFGLVYAWRKGALEWV